MSTSLSSSGRASYRLLRWVFIAGSALACGLLYYLAWRGLHPFGDVLAQQAVVTGGLGLVGMAGLHGLYQLMARRRVRMGRAALTLLGAALGVGVVWHALARLAALALDPFEGQFPFEMVAGATPWLSRPEAFVLLAVGWAGLYLGLAHVEGQQAREAERLRTDALATRARLQLLRYQLSPHFLFNALNSIGALADEAPARIRPMVAELSGFLRYALLDPDRQEVPLTDELDAAARYLGIEKIRFEEDLAYEIDLEAAAARQSVLAFLVLPLVENAVKHGQHTSPAPLRIRIGGRMEAGALVVEVANTGRWVGPDEEPKAPAASGTGTGLRNVQARLEARYPGRHCLETEARDGWVHVRIRLELEGAGAPEVGGRG